MVSPPHVSSHFPSPQVTSTSKVNAESTYVPPTVHVDPGLTTTPMPTSPMLATVNDDQPVTQLSPEEQLEYHMEVCADDSIGDLRSE